MQHVPSFLGCLGANVAGLERLEAKNSLVKAPKKHILILFSRCAERCNVCAENERRHEGERHVYNNSSSMNRAVKCKNSFLHQLYRRQFNKAMPMPMQRRRAPSLGLRDGRMVYCGRPPLTSVQGCRGRKGARGTASPRGMGAGNLEYNPQQ